MFDFTFSPLTTTLLALTILSFLYAAIIGLKPFINVIAKAKTDALDNNDTTDKPLPKASVIVYSFKAETIIREYLETLLSQDYPDFEIIVANDCVIDDMTQQIVEEMTKSHKNLHLTFVPIDSRNLSRRKLALTLGIKAAKGDIILTTSPIAKIKSDKWLKKMMTPFTNPETEIVIGYTHTDKTAIRGIGRWYRSFDNIMTSIQWLNSAISRKTYRGDGLNLAYRKATFFKNKGFAKTIHLQNGEDDLFISQIATTDNVAVQLSPLTHLIVDWQGNEKRMWADTNERYSFTANYLKTPAFKLQNIFSISIFTGLTATILTPITSLPNLIPTIIATSSLLTFSTYAILKYRKAASMLGGIRLWWSVPLFIYLRPIINFFYKLNYKSRKTCNFTWQRKK